MSDTENMTRESRFSFRCNRCSRCCHNKIIKVNPYEVSRLARNWGMDTTSFIQDYTVDSGTSLRFNPDGSCVFLTTEGCAVHEDRPFVCRLYPLLRHVSSKGGESFGIVERLKDCEGRLGTDGTVAGYLSQQDADEYIESVDAYLELTAKILVALDREMNTMREQTTGAGDEEHLESEPPDPEEVLRWLDTDHMLSQHTDPPGSLKDADPAAKMRKHLRIIEDQLDTYGEREEHGSK